MSRSTLIAFATHQDPTFCEAGEDAPRSGPLLSALAERRFDRVVILARPQRREQAERTAKAAREAHPRALIELEAVDLADPCNHPEVLAQLRLSLKRIRARGPEDEWGVILTGDTAEIHACWVILLLAGELPARLFNFRRPAATGPLAARSLREVRWRDAAPELGVGLLAFLSDKRGELYDEAAVVQEGQTSGHLFTPRTLEAAAQLARSPLPVLIQSEPGTQKTLFAALLHQLSARDGQLVVFNCATVPAEFAEAALLGEGEGDGFVPGKLQLADRGTLLLIKFQRLPEKLQLAVLRAAEENEFRPVAGHVRQRVNLRIIATTDLDLALEVTRGRFNAEVFRRLRANLVRLPPLRERHRELPLLIRTELERANRRQPRPKRLTPTALAKLESHSWPSNLSELRRVIEQAFLNAAGTAIGPDDIEFDLSTNLDNHFVPAAPRIRRGFSIETYLRGVKHELVQIALRKTQGNQSEAARMLGVTPQAVNKFLRTRRPAAS
jgi:sigma54-dependent transcription regulator